jgi:hypothetical protein
MSYASRLGEELAALKDELSKTVDEHATEAVAASREKLEELATTVGSLLEEIEQAVSREEQHVEELISSRPILSVAAAFLAGLALGYVARRRP